MDKLETYLHDQAVYAVDLKAEEIPETVRERAKWVILDSAGCILKGMQGRERESAGSGDERIMRFAMAMISTELYEGNRKAVGHPACHILPLMFAQTAEGEMPYSEFVRNFVAAYETAARWGQAIRFPQDVLGHGTVMVSGAAVAEGLYRGCSAEELYELLLLAGSLPEVSVWQSVYDGSALHDAYAGIAALTARKCLWMSRQGVRSTGRIIRAVYGGIMGAKIEEEKLAPSGEYLLASNYFKVHTGCRFVHPFADLLKEELERGLRKEEVSEIHVYTYKKAARLSSQSVPNDLAAKFSIPVSLAVQLEKGELTPDSIRGSERDSGVAAWEGRIWVHEDEKYNRLLPDIRGGRLEITMKNGETLVRETTHAAGDFDNPKPYTEKDVIRKFRENAKGVLTGEEQEKMIDAVVKSKRMDRSCRAVFAPLLNAELSGSLF